MSDNLRAKIFISCGQTKSSIEEEIAIKIKEILWNEGFDPYLAVVKQHPRSIRENIFNELKTSEYFLFIDFKREKIIEKTRGGKNEQKKEYRGSLFCHQELAIASFLEIPFIAFQQRGVKEYDGISGYLQWSPVPFDDPKELPELISNKIKKKIGEGEWMTNWKNQLIIKRNSGEFEDAKDVRFGSPPFARYYHLEVHNLNPHRQAINCYGFLEKIVNLNTRKTITPRTIELKWGGYILPDATILPNSQRHLDAFFVLHKEPNKIRFNFLTDSDYYRLMLDEPDEYELTFRVISDNFQPAISTFYLKFGDDLNKIVFTGKN